ncbi:MAG: 4-hydroxy-tetrahydrodipicolinate reductase [Planctomycetota bacterium]|jgi:4-hydroxy-tetrahydrodipicolinate reductase
MAQLRLIVLGAAGRMGRRLVQLTESLEEVEVVGALIRPDDPRAGDDAGLIAGTNVLGVPLSSELPDVEADAVIDFSTPIATHRFVPLIAERGLPVVIATTGLGAETRARIVEAAQRVPVMVAPNLSVGVALLTRLVREAATQLGLEADVEIIESHHRNKADAPSGTALHLAEAVAEAREQELAEAMIHGRSERTPEGRPRGEIAMHALRLANVVGEHTVVFGFGSERIELTHKSHSRDIFCRGALTAARFLLGRAPGLYGPGDLVGAGSGS